MSSITGRIVLIVLFCFYSVRLAAQSSLTPTPTPQPPHTQRHNAGVTGWEAIILKRAIVSSLAVRSVGENSQSAYNKWNDNIADLLVLFDRLNSPDDLKTFASLSGYHMGEATGSLYECIALRKGRDFAPYLQQAQKTAGAECQKRFGNATVYGGLRNSVCVDLTVFVRNVISELRSGQTCSNSQLAGTMGD
jgi:hypothetical protein